jgi:hypothetical protein
MFWTIGAWPRLISTVFSLAIVGCSGQSLSFIVVDANTMRPIGAVSAVSDVELQTWSGYVDEVRWGGSTDSAGRVTVDEIRSDNPNITSVQFESQYYYDVGFRIGERFAEISQRVPSRLANDGTVTLPADKDASGAYIIKMYPNPNGDPDIGLRNWTDNPHIILKRWRPYYRTGGLNPVQPATTRSSSK